MASIHFQKKLIHTCTIQRNTPAQSGSGEPIASWANSSTGVSCRFVEKSERIAVESVSLQMMEEPILLFDDGVDVVEEDRITNVVLKADSSVVEAGPLTVEAVLKRNTGSAHHIRVNLERVE